MVAALHGRRRIERDLIAGAHVVFSSARVIVGARGSSAAPDGGIGGSITRES